MSMSAEQVLVNCEKQFSFIKNDLNFVLSQIKAAITECEALDHSKSYKNDLIKCENKINESIEEINNNAFNKSISSNTHMAIETYNRIQKYCERKRDEVVLFKMDVLKLKNNVLSKELELISKNIKTNNVSDFDNLLEEIIESHEDNNLKHILKVYFADNKTNLINKKLEEILIIANEVIQNQKPIGERIKNILTETNKFFKNEHDEIKIQDIELNLINQNIDVYKNMKQFFKSSSMIMEQASIRKDNVIKLVNTIRKLGYIVEKENIRTIIEKNVVIIHAEKDTGEYADFAVQLDGHLLINSEGFEQNDHDKELKAIINELNSNGVWSIENIKKIYREPAYIAKKGQKRIVKKTNNSK